MRAHVWSRQFVCVERRKQGGSEKEEVRRWEGGGLFHEQKWMRRRSEKEWEQPTTTEARVEEEWGKRRMRRKEEDFRAKRSLFPIAWCRSKLKRQEPIVAKEAWRTDLEKMTQMIEIARVGWLSSRGPARKGIEGEREGEIEGGAHVLWRWLPDSRKRMHRQGRRIGTTTLFLAICKSTQTRNSRGEVFRKTGFGDF